jgi:hypothetical protein
MKNKLKPFIIEGYPLESFLGCIDVMRSEGLGISRITFGTDPNGTITLYPRDPTGGVRKKVKLRVIEAGLAVGDK